MSIDSNVTILRWLGGEGGDTLLKIIVGSNPELHSNIKWGGTNNVGKTMPIESIDNEIFINLPSAVNIAIGNQCKNVTVNELEHSIIKLKSLSKNFMLKSHWYTSSIFNNITIDLVTSTEMLPFTVGAMVQKNSKNIQNYSQLREKIKDSTMRKSYDLYNISWNRLHNTVEYSDNQIPVEVLVGGWDVLKNKLKEFNLLLDDKYKIYYVDWLDKNQQYLPSDRYKELVNACNFNYADNQLSLTEKYCLLAMSKKKFTILH
jgi:hypothetical protein